MSKTFRNVSIFMLALSGPAALAATPDLDQELAAIIRDYDGARFNSANDDARGKAYGELVARADKLSQQFPARAEPLVWKGILQADQSATERSLSLVKQARKTLEAALTINPNAYAADGYATLGSMYANVPGFPLAFGDKKKAQEMYLKSLSLNSSSLSANSGYARLLFKKDDYAGAVKYATAALAAPPRPGREQADSAGRKSAEELLANAKAKVR